jgi:hypothetical protein
MSSLSPCIDNICQEALMWLTSDDEDPVAIWLEFGRRPRAQTEVRETLIGRSINVALPHYSVKGERCENILRRLRIDTE